MRVNCLPLLAAVLLIACAGCSSVGERNPVPLHLLPEASIPGMGQVRYWGDEMPADALEELKRRLPYLPRLAESPPENGKPVVNLLAVSSGGGDGAFAAGLLVGWTRSGQRPRFEVVTGVSAGALIAPFAFLGPAYDRELVAMWTQYRTRDLMVNKPLAMLFGGSALADSGPLADLIAQYVDRRTLDAIAAEYRKGRILLIGTTNLDAQRPVVWNMTQIAASRDLNAVRLFRQVLLASASVPGIFPPVHISVEAGGHLREEMHVDGGTSQKVFIAPLQLPLHTLDPLYSAPPQYRIFVLTNTKLGPEWKPPADDSRAITERSLQTLSKSQAAGDLIRLYLVAKRDGAEFRLAAIPADFREVSREPFDRRYMRALFDVGFQAGRAGYHWLTEPPEIAGYATSAR
jgi:predicted acylesterase/phospholipase RssA